MIKIYLIFIAFNICYIECKPNHRVPNVLDNRSPLILTPYIVNNQLSEAKRLSRVQRLPNAPDIESYSGFFTINARFNSNIFFWFFPSFKDPQNAPLVVWLDGGPGSSSLFGLFLINGPFVVDNNLNVTLRPDSWVEEFSMLYVDNPVGTGFSYTLDERGLSTDENSIADNLYEFLKQFYEVFNEYRDNELYFNGESYAGKYIPAIGYKLMQHRNELSFNFKGIAVGNGLTDPITQMDSWTLMHDIGLIDKRQALEVKDMAEKCKAFIRDSDYEKGGECMLTLLSKTTTQRTGYKTNHNLLVSGNVFPGAENIELYVDLSETRQAIHVGDTGYGLANQSVVQALMKDVPVSVLSNLTEVMDTYKVMLYVGNLDMVIGVVQMNGMLENPDWKYYSELDSAERVVWRRDPKDEEIAGYVKSFGNFTYVVVRNAGHTVPSYQLKNSLDMMKRFVSGQGFGN